MPDNQSADYVVPVISEEVHADAVPVETGGVRVIKRVEGHDEIVEQELRKGRVEVRRVATNRAVDGPQQARREGNTLIVPLVSEVLRVEKHWVVTEEIHITQLEERERVAEKVSVNHEVADVQRLDESGNAVGSVNAPRRIGQVLPRQDATIPERKVLSGRRESMVKK
jgi:stress response protein YsnF